MGQGTKYIFPCGPFPHRNRLLPATLLGVEFALLGKKKIRPGLTVSLGKQRPLGQLIRETRRRRGLSVVDFATRCNVTRGMAHAWEHKTYILPTNLGPIARALEVPIDALYQANGQRKKA
jgi:DNA-binding XRE family transcriptional regulator